MAEITFFSKPGDAANAKQKAQLVAAGHRVAERDVMSEAWTAATLRPFFGDKPVEAWFHRFAPEVRSGAVDPAALGEAEALALMVANPDLIRRPLLEAEGRREAGFHPTVMQEWVGILPLGGGETCEDKHKRGVCDHGHQGFPRSA